MSLLENIGVPRVYPGTSFLPYIYPQGDSAQDRDFEYHLYVYLVNDDCHSVR